MRNPGITNELKHLINLKLEHGLNVSEQQRLDSLLSGSEDARNYLRQMEEMDASLHGMAGSSPQTDISQKVMQRIMKAHKPQTQTRSFSLPARLAMQSRPLLRFAAILVVGVMIGSALTMVFSTGKFPGNRHAAVGTIGAGGARVTTFGEDDWQLQMQSMVVDQTITLVLTAYASEDVQVGISFDPAVYRLIKAADISETPAPPASAPSASALGHMVHLHVEGHNRYIMVLQKRQGIPARPLQMEVIKNEILVRKQEINIL